MAPRIFDLHCDTLLKCYMDSCGLRKNSGHLDLVSMSASGALAQVFAIFLPTGKEAKDHGIELAPYELFNEIYSLYCDEIAMNKDLILPAFSYQDVIHNEQSDTMSSLLSVEDGGLLDGYIDRLVELYEKGVRLITILWNNENCIGFPNSGDYAIHQKGLKPFGIEVVEQMNRLGIIIDVSHLSEGGFDDVAKHSKKPFVASHSNAKALCGHPRNLTDRQLKLLAESGGAAGVNFYSEFLRDNSRYTNIEDIVRHVDHMVSVMGEDGVALGSDFDGIDCGLEIEGYSQYGKLISELSKKYPDDKLEKICYNNAMRIIKECL